MLNIKQNICILCVCNCIGSNVEVTGKLGGETCIEIIDFKFLSSNIICIRTTAIVSELIHSNKIVTKKFHMFNFK